MAVGTAAALGIGAGLGLLKQQGEQQRFDSQKKVQAATTRYSPWTHMQGQAPQYGSGLLGNLAGGTASGLLYSQANPESGAAGADAGATGAGANQGLFDMSGVSGPGTGGAAELADTQNIAASPYMAIGASQTQPSLYGARGAPWKIGRY